MSKNTYLEFVLKTIGLPGSSNMRSYNIPELKQHNYEQPNAEVATNLSLVAPQFEQKIIGNNNLIDEWLSHNDI